VHGYKSVDNSTIRLSGDLPEPDSDRLWRHPRTESDEASISKQLMHDDRYGAGVRLGWLAGAVKRKLIVDPFLGISLALEVSATFLSFQNISQLPVS
jgi:hypothetical protein